MKNILLTGGCGFVGSVLTQALLKKGYRVVILDNQWFGNFIKQNKNLSFLKHDIRDLSKVPFKDFDVVIHLANIANDPGVELNPSLSWEVNALATQQLANESIKNNISQFIYASSGSVYGVKKEKQVTEDLDLVPISAYNKTKMVSERVLLSYKNDMKVHCIRPATVCGWSPRMRLDVSVNMLTWQALKNNRMTVFGGNQVRPNIHIADMVNVYNHFLENPDIESGCYNAGFENISILSIAKKVQKIIPTAEIIISESNDPRSYRQNSDKLINTGFSPKYNIDDAIEEIVEKFKQGILKEEDHCYTVKWMQRLNLDK